MNEANVTTLMYSNSFVENSPIFGNIYIYNLGIFYTL